MLPLAEQSRDIKQGRGVVYVGKLYIPARALVCINQDEILSKSC